MPIDIDRLTAALADRYAVEREIGRGGMATVYLAEDLKHKRQVAVKVLEPELAASLGAERFLREIETAARLNHPHILPLYDSGEADGFLFYAMPYMEGSSLRDRLDRETQLPVEDAVRLARDVAGGLDYAHEQGIIHRDIKPGNIMLSRGHAVIADFGIARAVDEAGGERVTKTGISLGSPVYMSPEQASGSKTVDGRADIYALGCVLYEMLAGEPPYTGKTTATIVARKELEAAPRLSLVRDTVPDGVDDAIAKALAKVPADRFGTAAEFAEALESPGRTAAPRPRRRIGRRVIAAAFVIAIAATGWLLGPGSRAGSDGGTRVESIAVLPFADMSATGDQAYLGAGIAEVLLNALARLPDLRVPGRSASFRFDEPNPDVREVGRILDVEAVVEGSVRADDDTIRITVQLVKAADGFQLWSESYAREARNIFAVQEEIVREIVGALGVALAGADTTNLVDVRETSPEVYDLYQRGSYQASRGLDRESKEKAVDMFLRAVAIDSTYAPAFAALASAYGALTLLVPGDEVEALRELRRNAAERAFALDRNLPVAVAAHANLLKGERRFEEAEAEFIRALQLDPANAAVQTQYAQLLILMKRHEESVREARHAVALDPLSLSIRHVLIGALSFSGQNELVIEEADKALELDAEFGDALWFKSDALRELGRYDEAIATAERLVSLFPDDHTSQTVLAYAHATAGHREETIAVIATAQELGLPLKEAAIIYGMLGDLDTAYEYLERALAEEPQMLFFMDTDPTAEALRGDPRWDDWWARAQKPE